MQLKGYYYAVCLCFVQSNKLVHGWKGKEEQKKKSRSLLLLFIVAINSSQAV